MPTRRERAARPRDALPPRLRLPLVRSARGELPANVALTHLLIAARDSAEVDSAVAVLLAHPQLWDRSETDRLHAVRDLWTSTPNAFALVKEIIGIADHGYPPEDAQRDPAHWASVFDRAAQASTPASVALYSLGRSDLFRAVTDEVVARMRAWGLLDSAHIALDLGCGEGRILEAVSSDVRHAIGIDVSHGLLRAACARCAGHPNTGFILSSGHDLTMFADREFDVVYAIDSFPYLVQSDLAAHHMREAARILKPAGWLLIVNYSYLGDLASHRAEIGGCAAQYGFQVLRNGSREFKLWDGVSFLLQRH